MGRHCFSHPSPSRQAFRFIFSFSDGSYSADSAYAKHVLDRYFERRVLLQRSYGVRLGQIEFTTRLHVNYIRYPSFSPYRECA